MMVKKHVQDEDDDGFWAGTKVVLEVVMPVLLFIKMADKRAQVMGEVWWKTCCMQQHMDEVEEDANGMYALIPEAERKQLPQIILKRWKYYHSPLHSFAYAVNPKYRTEDHFGDAEVDEDSKLF